MPSHRWAVIDSNILIVANRKSPQANGACIESCINLLLEVSSTTSLAIDEDGEILSEYSGYCNYSGQPGVGDQFFLWVFNNQYTYCKRVSLTPDEDRGYREFPDIPELQNFDRSDRKFIATAVCCTPAATIYNAVDSDYDQFAQPLANAGIKVAELCPDCLKSSDGQPQR